MGILSGLFRPRDKPRNRTAGSAYGFLMGGSTSGKYVNERSAMQMTAVYSCVRILSESVAGLHCTFTDILVQDRKRRRTTRSTICFTMSRTRR